MESIVEFKVTGKVQTVEGNKLVTKDITKVYLMKLVNPTEEEKKDDVKLFNKVIETYKHQYTDKEQQISCFITNVEFFSYKEINV